MKKKALISLFVVFVAAGTVLGDFSGRLVSVSADGPITVGDSLSFTATVKNTGSEGWWYEWVARVDNTSWSVPWSYSSYYAYDYPSPGELSTKTFSLGANSLPTSPGNYSFRVRTYTWDDWGDGFWMSNIPQTVNFSIIADTAPTADAGGPYNIYPPGHPSRSIRVSDGKLHVNDWWRNIGETEWYVTLDGSGSSDNGAIDSYMWDLNGDAVADVTGRTVDVSMSVLESLGWTGDETRAITLTVTDNGSPGLKDSDTTDLTMILEPEMPGDTNGDDAVDLSDYENLIAQLGGSTGAESADFNGDGLVTLEDFVIMRRNLGLGVGSAPDIGSTATTPEPATMTLIAAGLPLLLKRKRKS